MLFSIPFRRMVIQIFRNIVPLSQKIKQESNNLSKNGLTFRKNVVNYIDLF